MEIVCKNKNCGNPFLERIELARFSEDRGFVSSDTSMPQFTIFRCPVCGDVFEIASNIVNYRVQMERQSLVANLKNKQEIFRKNILSILEEHCMNNKPAAPALPDRSEIELVKNDLSKKISELNEELEELRSEVKKLKAKTTKADKVKVDERLKD